MDKIKRYRNKQEQSFEDFFNIVTDTGICEFCDSYNECLEYIGLDNLSCISGNGCSAFDTSVEKLKKQYLLKYCKVGT